MNETQETYKSVIERILEHDPKIFGEPDLLADVLMTSQAALFLLFSACYDSRNTKAVAWILDNIRDPHSYVDPESQIFALPLISETLLTFIVTSCPDRFSLANCIDCLIYLDANDITYSACIRALRVLGDTDFLSWVNFAMTAEDYGNETVWLFCYQQAKRTAPYRKKPKYMIPAPDITKIEDTTTINRDPPADTSPEVLYKMVQELENNVERFRFLGPANILTGSRSRDVLSGLAELRMFEDNRITADDEERENWFTGNCDECWYKIRDQRHAVRKPLVEGGWQGEFCSWDCVRLHCDDNDEIIQREMTFYFEEQMNKHKIYDNVAIQ